MAEPDLEERMAQDAPMATRSNVAQAPKESELEKSVKSEESAQKQKGFWGKALHLAWKSALAVGTTAFGMATFGSAVPIIAGSVALGNMVGSIAKKKSLYDIINNTITSYSVINTVVPAMTLLGNATFPLAGALGYNAAGPIGEFVARSAYGLTGFNAAFVALEKASRHLHDNYLNPVGMGKAVTDNFGEAFKRTALGFAPGYLLVANGIPEIGFNLGGYGLKLPSFAANAFPFTFYNQINPIPYKKKDGTTAAASAPKRNMMPGLQPA